MSHPRTDIYRAIRDRTRSITTTAPPTDPPGAFWLTHATDAVMDLLMTREQQGADSWAHCRRCGGMLADYPTGDMRCRGCEAEAERDRLREALAFYADEGAFLAALHDRRGPNAEKGPTVAQDALAGATPRVEGERG